MFNAWPVVMIESKCVKLRATSFPEEHFIMISGDEPTEFHNYECSLILSISTSNDFSQDQRIQDVMVIEI